MASEGSKDEYSAMMEKAYEDAKAASGDAWSGMDSFIKTHRFLKNLGDASIDEKVEADFFKRQLEREKMNNGKDIRVRDTEYAILSTPRIVVGNEVQVLRQHAAELFRWYEDSDAKAYYAAPCMPIVQSSGTGKTKLLSDFRRDEEVLKDHDVVFISCLPKDTRRHSHSDAYDIYLNFNSKENDDRFLPAQLNEIVGQETSNTKNKLVLLFDEAQEMSRDEARHIHALRRYLRQKRDRRVIAVIAGTNQSLANCYPTQQERKSSREGESKELHHQSGENVYYPMYELFTMGCLTSRITFREDASEFDRAVPYGRPLFARMLFDEHPPDKDIFHFPVEANASLSDTEMCIVATRMLINHLDPFSTSNNLLPFASIWATRVQLGSVQAAVVETLVAKGYAHLTSFHSNRVSADMKESPKPSVSFTFMPDPVCARLAMCLMQDGWKIENSETKGTIKGKSKAEWTAKLKELCSSDLCRPSRGDLGEVVSAAYLLFCGDALRYRQDQDFKKFSVPVVSWVSLLQDPRMSTEQKSGTNEETNMDQGSSVYINFIQFCRNDLRFGLRDVCNQAFLEHIYSSCCAVYAYEGCPLFDAYASIRCSNDQEKRHHYIPLLMSIKTREGYSDGAAKKNIDAMAKELWRIGQKEALLLAVLLDRSADDDTEEKSNDESEKEDLEGVGIGGGSGVTTKRPRTAKGEGWQTASRTSLTAQIEECRERIVSRIISIPTSDPFGLTNVVRGATRSWEGTSLFAAHSFTGAMPVEDLVGCRKGDRGKAKAVLTRATLLDDKLGKLWNKRHFELQGCHETEAMDLS